MALSQRTRTHSTNRELTFDGNRVQQRMTKANPPMDLKGASSLVKAMVDLCAIN
jgi:hypothetical protein